MKGSLESALGKPKSWDASAEMGNVIRVQYETEQTHQSLKDAAVKAGLFDAADIRVESSSAGSDTDFRIYLPGVKTKVERLLVNLTGRALSRSQSLSPSVLPLVDK